MKKKKWLERFKLRGKSVMIPMVILMILTALVPMLLQAMISRRAFNQTQLEAKGIEIQNQCLILSSRLMRSGYMTSDKGNTMELDTRMQTIADIYNGRIVIVNSSFKIMKDTFNLAAGKYYVSEEVIRCFNGETNSRMNQEMGYLTQTIPIHSASDKKKVTGVMVVMASTENISALTDRVQGSTQLFLLCMILVVVVCSMAAVFFLIRPFKRLLASFERVSYGDLDTDIMEDAYKETIQLSQAVQKSLRKLKAVDQSRQEFVSNVSHELKTPITSIRVLADSLMGMEDTPKELYQEFMHDISDEIDRESKIIDDLLTLVRMDKASSGLSCSQVQINGLIEMVLKRLRPIARKRNIELIFESKRDVSADIDEVKFSLAVNNLVENAVKYNKEDGWVRVTLDADHKFFYLKVADSGIGIPAEFKERVFERFYRVDKARSRETGGTGLGLAITKSVVLMHHGAIRVDSVEGEGSTFMVRIPLIYIP